MFRPIPVVRAFTEIFSPIPVVNPEAFTATRALVPVRVPEEVTFKPVPEVKPLAVTVKTPVEVVTLLAVMVTALVEPAPASWVKAAANPVEAWVLFCWTSRTVAESVRVEVAPMVGAALTILAMEPETV